MIYLVDTDVLVEILRNNRVVAEELITFNLRHYPMPEVKVRTVRRTS